MPLEYPNDKKFIFTIFDDTDVGTLEYIKPIYDFLDSINLKTTKSVWPLTSNQENDYTGSHTLEDPEYTKYLCTLQDKGFEIAFHGATMVSSKRSDIERSLHQYHSLIGSWPKTYAPHSLNRDNLYWGHDRFSFPFFRKLYKLLSSGSSTRYQGHIKGSSYFWGDYSLEHLDYVRNLTYYDEINLLNISRSLPYSNRKQPYVKSFFFSCDADNVEEFNQFLNTKNQEKLEREGGVCILSTHFGKGFLKNGELHPETKRLLTQLSKKNGWFVPVHTALEYLEQQRGSLEISRFELFKLELFWFLNLFKRKKLSLPYEQTEIDYLKTVLDENINGNE